jgi:hypothetical protein
MDRPGHAACTINQPARETNSLGSSRQGVQKPTLVIIVAAFIVTVIAIRSRTALRKTGPGVPSR